MVAADMAKHAEESRASAGSVHMGWICAKAWKESKELHGRLRPFFKGRSLEVSGRGLKKQ